MPTQRNRRLAWGAMLLLVGGGSGEELSPFGAPPGVSGSTAGQVVNEGVGTVTVQATLIGTSGSDVLVPITVGGSAVVGADYDLTVGLNFDPSTGVLTIPAGSTTASLLITIYDDVIKESQETITLIMGEPSGADLGEP